MTTFTDGPAVGVVLGLARAPTFLRVVQNRFTKTWDALDQLKDTPDASEDITAYRLVEDKGVAHVDYRDPKTGRRRGGWYRMATYAVVAAQPDQGVMRSTATWQQWCYAEFQRTKKEKAES